ncbi:conjugal transfer protein TraD [Mesorhizobium sp. M0500]|uniref:conjugal transfer protein TraD n=2 Tax=unclassified Mesorhizobium TaxID=325217 RepID=UPI00333C4BF1
MPQDDITRAPAQASIRRMHIASAKIHQSANRRQTVGTLADAYCGKRRGTLVAASGIYKRGLKSLAPAGTIPSGLADGEKTEILAMARTSLAERMSRLEQQRAKLTEQEARLKADERKQRTRRLVEAGTLIERAGLIDLEEAALYGGLLSLAEGVRDKAQLTEWIKTGKTALDRETVGKDATHEPLTITFPAPLPTPFATRLRGAGLRWSKVMQHWEGLADHDAVAALAAEQNGSVRRIHSTEQPDREPDRGRKSERS